MTAKIESNTEKAEASFSTPPLPRTSLELDTACSIPEGCMERHDGPTPSGGVCSVIHYMDAQRNPAPKDEAVQCRIMEYNAEEECIYHTSAYTGDWSINGSPEFRNG